jgi:hypothetical protein
MTGSRASSLLAASLFIALLAAHVGTQAQGRPARGTPPDRTTPIQKQMTPAQHRHARLFGDGGFRLLDWKQNLEVEVDPGFNPATKPLAEVIADLACASDAVFLGVVSDSRSWPTENGTMLFTEYTVHPTEIFRTANSASVTPGRSVTVVRPGGEMSIEGTMVRASINIFPPLEGNERYILFTKYLPDTGAFQTRASKGTLVVHGSEVVGTIGFSATDGDLISPPRRLSSLLTTLRGVSCR